MFIALSWGEDSLETRPSVPTPKPPLVVADRWISEYRASTAELTSAVTQSRGGPAGVATTQAPARRVLDNHHQNPLFFPTSLSLARSFALPAHLLTQVTQFITQ